MEGGDSICDAELHLVSSPSGFDTEEQRGTSVWSPLSHCSYPTNYAYSATPVQNFEYAAHGSMARHLHHSALRPPVQPHINECALPPKYLVMSRGATSSVSRFNTAFEEETSSMNGSIVECSQAESLAFSPDSISSFTPAMPHSRAIPSSTLFGLDCSSSSSIIRQKRTMATKKRYQFGRRDTRIRDTNCRGPLSSFGKFDVHLDFDTIDLFPYDDFNYALHDPEQTLSSPRGREKHRLGSTGMSRLLLHR